VLVVRSDATVKARGAAAGPHAAMPGWKRDVECRLDALIVRTVPGVRM
jgi:hypothetical protein